MKVELELQRELQKLIPGSSAPEKEVTKEELAWHRKTVREATENLCERGLMSQGVVPLTEDLTTLMSVVASALGRSGQDPEVPDLRTAAMELIRTARIPLEKGLVQREWNDVRVGAVMIEIVVRGLCATLNIPYEDCLREVYRALRVRVMHVHRGGDIQGTSDLGTERPDLEGVIARHRRGGSQS